MKRFTITYRQGTERLKLTLWALSKIDAQTQATQIHPFICILYITEQEQNLIQP